MAKPYAGYKGNNLVDIIPRAIAFVTEGANKKRFFLFKHKQSEGDNSMNPKIAISLIKSGTLSHEQVQAIVESVNEDERAEVLAVAKAMDPEGATMSTFLKEFLPTIVKAAVTEALAGTKPGKEVTPPEEEDEEEGEITLKAVMQKLDKLLSKEEGDDEELNDAMSEAEEEADDTYKALKKKWEEGSLDDAESKSYMKMKNALRDKVRKGMKAKKLKAEKEAINQLSSSEQAENLQGGTRQENLKKIFSDDREIDDPAEITALMALATEAVETKSL